MNSELYEKEAPVLSREDAIAILNTPNEEIDALIDRAKSLRYKYKGNRVSIHILTNARSGKLFPGLRLLRTVMSLYRRY